jgi:phosphopantetheinyl transferase
MIITRLTGSVVSGDMVLKRDGRIWSVARDFVCQRFVNYLPVWNVILKPQFSRIAEDIAPGICFYESNAPENVLFLLAKRYLCKPDREIYESFDSARQKREHIISRIALKDAVRAFIAENGGEMLYPVEFYCDHDENGKPYVQGYGSAAEKVNGLCVSLAHKGDAAVAIVANEAVGIDLEKIEEKSEDFLKIAYTDKEIELLKSMDCPHAAIRFWVAKEASAKKAGTGLKGDPKHYEISAVEGDILFVREDRVRTAELGTDLIMGWTL